MLVKTSCIILCPISGCQRIIHWNQLSSITNVFSIIRSETQYFYVFEISFHFQPANIFYWDLLRNNILHNFWFFRIFLIAFINSISHFATKDNIVVLVGKIFKIIYVHMHFGTAVTAVCIHDVIILDISIFWMSMNFCTLNE